MFDRRLQLERLPADARHFAHSLVGMYGDQVHGSSGKVIEVGSSLKLYGGYDQQPRWLDGEDFHTGTVERRIPGQNARDAIVVRLSHPITVDAITGEIVVLELRYTGTEWENEGVVHIELCDFEPESKTWKDRKQGVWVESHASYEIT